MRRLGVSVALLILVAVTAPVAWTLAQADATVSLDQALALVVQAQSALPSDQPRLAQAALTALDADPGLATNQWLREPLAANPPNLDLANRRLGAARATLGPVRPPTDPTRARATLFDVLADPRFHEGDWSSLIPGWLLPAVLLLEGLKTLIWNVVRWPFDRFLDLLDHFVRGPGILAVVILIVAAVLLILRRGVRSALVRQAEIGFDSLALPPTAAEALTAAQERAARGHYRDACHYVFLSTLLWIEEHSQTRFEPAATNREHLTRVSEAPAVRAALAPVVARFDRLWYGQDAVTEADYRVLLQLAGAVREVPA